MIAWLANHLTILLEATGATGVFLTMLLESAWLPLPSEIILPFAGILVVQGSLTFWGAVGWAVAGQMAGSLLVYSLGAFGGRPLIEQYGRYVLVRRQELALAERWFNRFGDLAVFATRLMPAVRALISLPAGMARMPLWRFSLFSFLGTLPWTTFLVWTGMKVGKVWQDPRWQYAFRLVEVGIAAFVLGLVAMYVVKRHKEQAGSV